MIELPDLCRPLPDVEAQFAHELEHDAVMASLDSIWNRGGLLDADGRLVPTHHSVGRRDGTILYGIARGLEPRTSIETGFAYGISAACLLAGAKGANHTSIDGSFRRWAGTLGLEHWRALGLAFELIEEPSEFALPRLAAREIGGCRVQLGFVDGVHTFDGALVDFFYLDRMLDAGGVIVLHDADAPAIETVVAFVRANRRYRVSDAYLPTIAVCQKLGDDAWDWGHFVPFQVAARRDWDRNR